MTLTLELDLSPQPDLPPPSVNPCVNQYGPGPEGVTCASCRWLIEHLGENACAWRPFAFDHRPHYPACAQYEEERA